MFDPSAIWAVASKGFNKGNNFLAGNGFVEDNFFTQPENAANRAGLGNSIQQMRGRMEGRDEFNRQISSDASKRYAELASMYPDLWNAKRKARFQSGALSALGGT